MGYSKTFCIPEAKGLREKHHAFIFNAHTYMHTIIYMHQIHNTRTYMHTIIYMHQNP